MEKPKENKDELSRPMIYFFMGIMLITGSINTIANKLQQSCEYVSPYNGQIYKYETHQKFITFCMFIGETICLAMFYIQQYLKKRKKEQEPLIPEIKTPLVQEPANNEVIPKEEIVDGVQIPPTESETQVIEANPQPKFWYFLFPALFDLCGSSIMSMSLTFLASSIYQMFRGAVIIFTASASLIFLKAKLHRHHVTGITIVVIGLIVVGLKAMLGTSSGTPKGSGANPVLGIILLISGQLFSAAMFITEEKLLKHYKAPPLKVVGMEGSWGVCTYIILLIIFYFIPCGESWGDTREKLCSLDDSEIQIYRFENPIMALRMLFGYWKLTLFAFLYISSIAFFNFAGLSVTKHVSSTARTIVDTCRTIIIWTFFMLPIVPEGTQETFDWKQLLGFVILVFGSLLYNEILVIPLCGFDQNTKEAIKKRKEQEKEQEKEEQKETNNENTILPVTTNTQPNVVSEEPLEKPNKQDDVNENNENAQNNQDEITQEAPPQPNEQPQEENQKQDEDKQNED